MTRRFAALGALLGAACVAGYAAMPPGEPRVVLTREEKAWIARHDGQIRLAPSPHWEPIEILTGTGEYQGLAADYIDLIQERTGLHFKVVVRGAWQEILAMARAREVDVLAAVMRTPSRSQYMNFTTSYLTIPTYIITRANEERSLELEEMRGVRIIIPEGYAQSEYVTLFYPYLSIRTAPNVETGLKMVSFGEADAILTTLPYPLKVINALNLTNLKLAGETRLTSENAIATRNDWPILHGIIQKGLDSISQAERKAIYRKWFHPGLNPSRIGRYILLAGGAAIVLLLCLSCVVAVWNRSLQRRVLRRTRALQDSEQRFRSVVESSMTGIAILKNDEILFKNPEMDRIFGPAMRIFPGKGDELIHPNDRVRITDFCDAVLADDPQNRKIDFRFFFTDRYGTTFLRWVYCRSTAFIHQGEPAILINALDVTHQKELEEQLIVRDKMASLGRVAAGIAHEIRNPLSGINILAETLDEQMESGLTDEDCRETVGDIQAASLKIESIIKRVMDFSKPSEPQFSRIDLNLPVKEAMKLSRVSLRKDGVQLLDELSRTPLPVMAQPDLIEEVVLNLINNAAEAMRDQASGKVIRISTLGFGGTARLSVSDSGPGVSIEDRHQILEPFFTTKAASSGIGLNLCQRIANDHGARFTIETSDLGGADFILRFEAAFPESPDRDQETPGAD